MLKIIGATGNVGKRLLEKSLHVWHDDVEAIATRLDKDELDYDFDSLKDGDVIAFCAAISEPTICAKNPELARKVNVEKTIEFIERSTNQGARVIFLSSDAVYGNIDYQFDEQWQTCPVGVYAEMKSEVEKYFKGNDMIKILRSSFNFFKEDRFTSYLHKCFLKGEVAEVFSPFERSVVHRDDTVDAILSLSRNWEGPQILNCGGPQTICRSEFAQILKEEVFPSLKIKIIRPPEQFYKDRPETIPMMSISIIPILGRSQKTLREAIHMEFDV